MTTFIDHHKESFGVEPICRRMGFASSTYYAAKTRELNPSARETRDRQLSVEMLRVFEDNRSVYGSNKLWHEMRREGIDISRCRVERLMRREGICGVSKGSKKPRTTIPGGDDQRASDLVDRNFSATRPNELWIADFTYVPSWEKTTYVAFVIDVFSRRIVGWKHSTSMKTELVLDAFEMAIWSRDHQDMPIGEGLVFHSDAGSQYTSYAYTGRLKEAGIAPSVGTVADALDNAMAESVISSFKNEEIGQNGPWKKCSDVELATLTWVDWYNKSRLHGALKYLPTVELEENYVKASASQ